MADRRRGDLRAAAQSRAAELADEPSRLRRASASRRSTRSTRPTSRTSSSPSRSRSAAPRATRTSRRPRWSRTASCTSPTPGAWSTRSTCAPARRAHRLEDGSRARRSSTATAASRCGAISSISVTGLRRPRHRDRQGDRQDRLGQEPARPARYGAHRRAARAQGQDHRRRLGRRPAACATGSPRSMPRPASVQWQTYSVPAPGEPGSETWKDKNNAWQTGGGAFYVTGSYDPDTNITYWGAGNPVPRYDSVLPARRQSLHQQRARHRCRHRQDRTGTSSTRRTT